MEWMLDIQLGRRNLSPIQRIAIAEKYRSLYEKQALINKQNAMREARKNNENNKNEQLSVNLPKTVPISTSEKLAEVANVSEKTYRMGAKILESNDEGSKLRALISNNFGRRKNDPSKDRKALETYVSLRGYKHGEIGGGHQRVQNGLSALTLDEIAKELKMSKSNLKRALRIERNLTDSMKELSEDEILADLIETNIRQRGIGNPNPVKLGRCIKELERIYGIQHGNNQYDRSSNNFKSIKTQEDLAQELGVTIQSINNYKKLAEMIPELEELVDTGITTPTTALAMMYISNYLPGKLLQNKTIL